METTCVLSHFTFYCILTGLSFAASFVFLLLTKPDEHHDIKIEELEDEEKPILQDVKEI